jgi:hypothetical protein
MPTTTTSGKFSLGSKDFWKGFIMAVGTPVLYFLQEYIPLMDNVPALAKIAISAAITYLIKNFFAPAQIVISDPHPGQVEAVNNGDAKAIVVNRKANDN